MNYYVYPGVRNVSKKHISGKAKTIRMDEGERVINLVNEYFNIDCRKRKRSSQIVEARQIVFKLIKKYTSLSCTDAGRLFGMDHTTVLHNLTRISNLIEVGDPIKYKYEGCEQYIIDSIR